MKDVAIISRLIRPGHRWRRASYAVLLVAATACTPTQSPTLAKYTDTQINRCMKSLTFKEQQEIQAAVTRAELVPFVGVFTAQEAQYKAAEKICKRKGILR